MNTAARRSAWLKLRVTPEEKESITAKATMQGQTVTDFLRQRALDYRLRQTPLEKERIRQLARIGANLNQLARWANTWKSRAEAVEILTALVSLERALLAKDTAPPPESHHVYEGVSAWTGKRKRPHTLSGTAGLSGPGHASAGSPAWRRGADAGAD